MIGPLGAGTPRAATLDCKVKKAHMQTQQKPATLIAISSTRALSITIATTIDFASRFPPRHLEASRIRGFEGCEVSKLRCLSIYDRLSRHLVRIHFSGEYSRYGKPEEAKLNAENLNPRSITFFVFSFFSAKNKSVAFLGPGRTRVCPTTSW